MPDFRQRLTEAYVAERARILSILRRRGASPEVAEDVVQDAYLSVLKHGSFGDGSNPEGYLVRAALNTFTNWYRKTARAGTRVGPDISDFRDVVSTEPGPEEAAIRADARGRISAACRTIPSQFVQPVVATYAYGVPGKDLADQLDTPLATVRTQTHRGKAHLAKALKEHGLGPDWLHGEQSASGDPAIRCR